MTRHSRRYLSAAIVAAVMTLSATTPANAVYDSEGNLVAIIITPDEVFY